MRRMGTCQRARNGRNALYGSRPFGVRARAESQEYLPSPPPRIEDDDEGIGHIAQLALPALVVVLSDPLQTLVDSAVLGRYSTLHLAAIGPNTALFNSMFQLFAFLGVTVANAVSSTASSGRTGTTGAKARRARRTLAATKIRTPTHRARRGGVGTPGHCPLGCRPAPPAG